MPKFQDVKDQVSLREFAETHLEAKGRDVFVCPVCGSGHGPNATAAFSIMPGGDKFKCFSCETTGDVFDLYGILNHTEDKGEQLRGVMEWARMPDTVIPKKDPLSATRAPATPEPDVKQEAKERCERELAEGRLHIEEAADYLKQRGWYDKAKELGWGYDPRRQRLLIPYRGESGWYHTDRDVTGTQKPKYTNPAGVSVPLYNPDVLKAPVFVVTEGELDAEAVMDATGYPATALGGNAGTRALLDALKAVNYRGTVLLALDNDPLDDSNLRKQYGGDKAEKLYDQLTEAKVYAAEVDGFNVDPRNLYNPADIPPYKDPDDLRRSDPGKLKSLVETSALWAESYRARHRKEAWSELHKHLNVMNPASVADGIDGLVNSADPISTGIDDLDRLLSGGLHPKQLYGVGAVSSMGKTTLVWQIADNLALAGHDVIMFTIEQSAQEMVGKSLSRFMRLYNMADKETPSQTDTYAKGKRGWILSKYAEPWAIAKGMVARASEHLTIVEAESKPTAGDIRSYVELAIEEGAESPLVVIDYLQLIAAEDPHDTEKMATDKAMTALRQIARDFNCPVVVISSLNRENYSKGISMAAFKESGGIEYGADVLLGIQPRGVKALVKEHKKGYEAKVRQLIDEVGAEKNARKLEVLLLKNRNGERRSPADLTFYPRNALFTDEK